MSISDSLAAALEAFEACEALETVLRDRSQLGSKIHNSKAYPSKQTAKRTRKIDTSRYIPVTAKSTSAHRNVLLGLSRHVGIWSLKPRRILISIVHSC